MSQSVIHVGDIGTLFELTFKEDGVAVDLTSATLPKMIFSSPSTLKTMTATIKAGTGGILQYTTIAGDIDKAGRWSVQLSFTLGSWSGKTSAVQFDVSTILAAP